MKNKRQTLKEYELQQTAQKLRQKFKKLNIQNDAAANKWLNKHIYGDVDICFKYSDDEQYLTAIYLKDYVTGDTYPENIQ